MCTATREMTPGRPRAFYFPVESNRRGTFRRDGRFCKHSVTGDDDEKTRPYVTDLNRADGSGDDTFACARHHQSAGFHSRKAYFSSADEWFGYRSGRQRFDRLDRWGPRTDTPDSQSRRRARRSRGGEESALDGDRRRFEGAADPVSGQSNTGIAFERRLTYGESVPARLSSLLAVGARDDASSEAMR
jgi:hypothetical protein